ncbi:type II toxin-antitoxin system VapC family toxin [Amphibiibacter pelophylacis]|uniref:PIN domain-containing protein n=1 Tax=Amphibiibacter pelophylacis TaxID=1799477 RepID=A0ACC6NZT2_9BURK
MNGVLADTSIWIDHFRTPNAHLMQLLPQDRILVHPMVQGEVACGTPPQRAKSLALLALLADLQPVPHASLREVLLLVEREKLYGQGCGLIDLMLLASVLLLPGARLWTLDRRLSVLTQRFGVHYGELSH